MSKKEEEVVSNELDMSLVKNVAAIKKADKGFSQSLERNMKKTSKFNFTDPELVELPSKGQLYQTTDKDIHNGFIKLFPMTVKEEEILSTSRFLKTGAATRMVLENCIASDISARDVLLFDSNYLLFRLRQISYGDKYTFSLRCDNSLCEKEFEHTVDITKLEFKELPEGFEEPIEVDLPRSKYRVLLILPRLAHSEELMARNSNKKKSTDSTDSRQIDNLIVTTVAIIDPNGNEVPRKDWEEFYESIPGIDAAELRDKTRFTTKFDELKDVKCPYCDREYEGSIPLSAEFFRFK